MNTLIICFLFLLLLQCRSRIPVFKRTGEHGGVWVNDIYQYVATAVLAIGMYITGPDGTVRLLLVLMICFLSGIVTTNMAMTRKEFTRRYFFGGSEPSFLGTCVGLLLSGLSLLAIATVVIAI